MEDFEIVSLMETLEDVGLAGQAAFKVVGTKVLDIHREAYIIKPVDSVNVSYDGQDWGDTFGNEYTEFEYVNYKYPVDFKQQFQEHFLDKIREMGKDYFYLNTSEPGVPSFTIWGNSSGIIKLKEEVKMKFPDALILEVEEYEHKN
jgi:hypothetical protein